MPTATGLPKIGEIWERTSKLPPDWEPVVTRFVVLERSRGDYWSLRVYAHIVGSDQPGQVRLWVDPSYWLSKGELSYVKEAGPALKQRLGIS